MAADSEPQQLAGAARSQQILALLELLPGGSEAKTPRRPEAPRQQRRGVARRTESQGQRSSGGGKPGCAGAAAAAAAAAADPRAAVPQPCNPASAPALARTPGAPAARFEPGPAPESATPRHACHGQQQCECAELKRRWLLLHRRDEYAGQVAHWRRSRGQTVVAKMTPAIRDMYRRIFKLLDEDGSGELDLHEIAIALKLVGIKHTMVQLKKEVEKYGNAEGELNLHAFLLVIEASTAGAALANRKQASQQQALHLQRRRAKPKKEHVARQRRRLEEQQHDAVEPVARDQAAGRPRLPAVPRGRGLKQDTDGGPDERQLDAHTHAHAHEHAEDEGQEHEHPEEQVLPFHLFLPACSRKKNLEFVMALGLKDSHTGLPYPLDESSAALSSAPSETDELLERLRAAARHCACPHRPSLIGILDHAEGRSTGIGAMVESWDASAQQSA